MPDATGPDQIFQNALAMGEIVLPRCDDCGAYHFFPRILCPHCNGTAISWSQASGKGRVHTTTVVRRKPERGGDYNICMVELEEGVRMMSRVEGIAPGDVTIDMAVTAFVGDAEGAPAVLFKPSEG
ncbi:MAG: Zn-ribbon domain-containing OB-fold protein [Paracoccus sp. (in: a-proteobacteria)]|uniref:Zn-ribbon domain-containing OB-fold protein n=1 Tax=Paracoccus sp. TaxID=267 RepID=UPI0040599B32